MPGPVPPATGNPYPIIDDVMNSARARINDMVNDTAGDLLVDSAPYAQTYLTNAWSWLQRKCATAGVETFIREITLYGLPARYNNDPANQAWLTWLGSSDGFNQYTLPVLPQDMIFPLSVWRRQTGMMLPFNLMTQAADGLPRIIDCNIYDWRDDGMFFYAALYSQDFQMRYSAYRPPLDITQPTQNVPIMMCEDCLGARVAFEFANARGSAGAPGLKAWADEAFDTIRLGNTRRRERRSLRRIPYNRRNQGRGNNAFPYIGS